MNTNQLSHCKSGVKDLALSAGPPAIAVAIAGSDVRNRRALGRGVPPNSALLRIRHIRPVNVFFAVLSY